MMGGRMSCAHKVSNLILVGPEKQSEKNGKNVDKKVDGRINPKAHIHLQTMTKTPAKIQKAWYKIVRGVLSTSYPLHRVTTKNTKLKKCK